MENVSITSALTNKLIVFVVVRLQAEDEKDKNGSEEEDDEKPGKRVAGPRKKFRWDDTVRYGVMF